MPKNSSVEILKRWKEMDRKLSRPPGLNVPKFAKRWNVSTRTVERDRLAFKALGKEMSFTRAPGTDGKYLWGYDHDVECLFVENMPAR